MINYDNYKDLEQEMESYPKLKLTDGKKFEIYRNIMKEANQPQYKEKSGGIMNRIYVGITSIAVIILVIGFTFSFINDTDQLSKEQLGQIKEKSIPMENLLVDDYGELLINKFEAANNESKTITDKAKIRGFQNIIQEISLIEIDSKEYQEIDKTRYNTDKSAFLSWILTSAENKEMNGYLITSLADGNLLVMEIKNNLGQQFYRTSEKSPKFYEDINDFYVNNAQVIEEEGVLDNLD